MGNLVGCLSSALISEEVVRNSRDYYENSKRKITNRNYANKEHTYFFMNNGVKDGLKEIADTITPPFLIF